MSTSFPVTFTQCSSSSECGPRSPNGDDYFSLVSCFSKQSDGLRNLTERVDMVYRRHNLARFQKLGHAFQSSVRFQAQNTDVSLPGSGNPSSEHQALDKSVH